MCDSLDTGNSILGPVRFEVPAAACRQGGLKMKIFRADERCFISDTIGWCQARRAASSLVGFVFEDWKVVATNDDGTQLMSEGTYCTMSGRVNSFTW